MLYEKKSIYISDNSEKNVWKISYLNKKFKKLVSFYYFLWKIKQNQYTYVTFKKNMNISMIYKRQKCNLWMVNKITL